MRLIKQLETELVVLKPAPQGHGITLHGIPAASGHVMKYDARVDLYQGPSIVFLAEHILAPLKLLGIEDVEAFGRELPWDFARPVHRFAYSLGMDTSHIFGPSDGRHCFDIAQHPDCLEPWCSQRYCTVRETVVYELKDYGRIEIRPARPGSGMHFQISAGPYCVDATVFVTRRNTDAGILKKVLTSRSPAVRGFQEEEPLWHAIGDFTADLCGIGNLTDAEVIAEVKQQYHAITIGAVKMAEERGLLVYEDVA